MAKSSRNKKAKKWPKPRNHHVLPARQRKAGVHTSTDKKRGGKRGGSKYTYEVYNVWEDEDYEYIYD